MLQQIRQLRRESNGKAQAGFTIIEVMIVLAIAGLIMAIVFLAVPALQRNNRNTQRNADASRVLAAVGTCMGNKNGQKSSCDQFEPDELNAYITVSENQQLTTAALSNTFPTGDAALNTVNLGWTIGCSADGASITSGKGDRAYAVLFLLETSGGTTTKCIAS